MLQNSWLSCHLSIGLLNRITSAAAEPRIGLKFYHKTLAFLGEDIMELILPSFLQEAGSKAAVEAVQSLFRTGLVPVEHYSISKHISKHRLWERLAWKAGKT